MSDFDFILIMIEMSFFFQTAGLQIVITNKKTIFIEPNRACACY
jgi:hypothetical protein